MALDSLRRRFKYSVYSRADIFIVAVQFYEVLYRLKIRRVILVSSLRRFNRFVASVRSTTTLAA